jgi:hypothetical protein
MARVEHSVKLQNGGTVFDAVASPLQHWKPVAGIYPKINNVCGHPATPTILVGSTGNGNLGSACEAEFRTASNRTGRIKRIPKVRHQKSPKVAGKIDRK